MGSKALADGAERAWVQGDALVAAISAADRVEARLKCRHLRSTVDKLTLSSPRASEHADFVAAIMAPVEAEATAGGFPWPPSA